MLDFEIRFTTAEGAGIGLPVRLARHRQLSRRSSCRRTCTSAGCSSAPSSRSCACTPTTATGCRGSTAARRGGSRAASCGCARRWFPTSTRRRARPTTPACRSRGRCTSAGRGAARAYRFDSQYMLGDELLVAPVAEPGRARASGSGSRRASGSTSSPGERHRGTAGRAPARAARPDAGLRPRRARSCPASPTRSHAARQADPLAIDVYAGADGSFTSTRTRATASATGAASFARTRPALAPGAAGDADDRPGARQLPRACADAASLPGPRFVGVDRPQTVTVADRGEPRELPGWSYDPAARGGSRRRSASRRRRVRRERHGSHAD